MIHRNLGRPLRILSLGAGVQSSALLLMSIRGLLPKLDHAIFADTQWEPSAVYRHLDWMSEQAAAAGIPVHRVTFGNLRTDALYGRKKVKSDGTWYVTLPIFVRDKDGNLGKVSARQCTSDYKIKPILRKVMELAGIARGSRGPAEPVVEQWLGISADETRRVRPPLRRWIVNHYPFIGRMRVWMSGRREVDDDAKWLPRQTIADWLGREYPHREVPRSACIGCPFRSNAEWRVIRNDAEAWADALEADALVRRCDRGHRKSDGYLHRDGVPLAEANLGRDDGQLLNWQGECQGMCGV